MSWATKLQPAGLVAAVRGEVTTINATLASCAVARPTVVCGATLGLLYTDTWRLETYIIPLPDIVTWIGKLLIQSPATFASLVAWLYITCNPHVRTQHVARPATRHCGSFRVWSWAL